ncbi:hypothetical protein PR048_001357, partial [Dryococelus australis]
MMSPQGGIKKAKIQYNTHIHCTVYDASNMVINYGILPAIRMLQIYWLRTCYLQTYLRNLSCNRHSLVLLTRCLRFSEKKHHSDADTTALLDTMSQLINTCQKSESNVADALPNGHDKLHFLDKRRNQSQNICSMSANVLYQKYLRQNLNEDYQVEGFIVETLNEVLA